MKVHDLPLVANTLQDKRAPLARRFAAQLECDDGVSIELLNQQILRRNRGRWTVGSGRIGVEDHLERSLDFRTPLNATQRRRLGWREEHGGVLRETGTTHCDIPIAERDEKIADDAFEVLLWVRLRASNAERAENNGYHPDTDERVRLRSASQHSDTPPGRPTPDDASEMRVKIRRMMAETRDRIEGRRGCQTWLRPAGGDRLTRSSDTCSGGP